MCASGSHDRQAGIGHGVFAALAGDANFEEVFIGSTIVRAHQHAAGAPQKKVPKRWAALAGAWARRFTRWFDGLGTLAKFNLTGAQGGDSPGALPLLGELRPGGGAADKAYHTDALIAHLRTIDAQAVIPSRANRREQRPLDKHLYRSRNLVERFFARIKQFRRATRYDKLPERFTAFVAVAASFIWLV